MVGLWKLGFHVLSLPASRVRLICGSATILPPVAYSVEKIAFTSCTSKSNPPILLCASFQQNICKAALQLFYVRTYNLQQHQCRTAAAVPGRRVAPGQHVRALRQPVARKFAQHRFAAWTVHSLAMDHQHAAQAALRGLMQELLQQSARRVAGVAVQVEAVLHRPVAAPQFAQGHARQAVAPGFVRRVFCTGGGQCVVDRGGRGGDAWQGFARRFLRLDAVLLGQRFHLADCRAEQRGVFGFDLNTVLSTHPFALSLSKGSGLVAGGSTSSPRTVKGSAWFSCHVKGRFTARRETRGVRSCPVRRDTCPHPAPPCSRSPRWCRPGGRSGPARRLPRTRRKCWSQWHCPGCRRAYGYSRCPFPVARQRCRCSVCGRWR